MEQIKEEIITKLWEAFFIAHGEDIEKISKIIDEVESLNQ